MDKSIRNAQLQPATAKNKKYKMTFLNSAGDVVKTTQFGQRGAEDFTIHKDSERRARYLARHKNDPRGPTTAGELSRLLLWGQNPDIDKQLKIYKQKFNIQVDNKLKPAQSRRTQK